jgi:hypothetical protein
MTARLAPISSQNADQHQLTSDVLPARTGHESHAKF